MGGVEGGGDLRASGTRVAALFLPLLLHSTPQTNDDDLAVLWGQTYVGSVSTQDMQPEREASVVVGYVAELGSERSGM